MGEVRLRIGGLCTSILTRDPAVARLIRDRYEGFVSAAAPDWRIEVRARGAGPVPFDDGVEVRHDGGVGIFSVTRADFAGTVDLRKRSGSVALAEPNEFSVDSFLRIVCSLALVEARGLLVHAASLIRNGKAYLFCGPSGSGKTTVARLSSDETVLSDELSIVRISEEGASCHGTPFWGELARRGAARAAPLAGVYFLHKGDRHAVEAIRPPRALGRLLPNVLHFAREADLTARVFGISGELVEVVPCFDLSFRLDPGFWEVIEND